MKNKKTAQLFVLAN